MIEQGDGQLLLITSAAGARPTPGAPLYSAARAGATMLAKNVAAEVARTGVQVNAIGTNFMDFPEFLATGSPTTPRSAGQSRPRSRSAASARWTSSPRFCMPFIDGTSRFTTGQFVAYAGGWA